jgi:hypothetical protein
VQLEQPLRADLWQIGPGALRDRGDPLLEVGEVARKQPAVARLVAASDDEPRLRDRVQRGVQRVDLGNPNRGLTPF